MVRRKFCFHSLDISYFLFQSKAESIKLFIFFAVGVGFMVVTAAAQVSLTSSSNQKYLCPDNSGMTFTCRTIGWGLSWLFNDHALFFRQESAVGWVESVNGFPVTLLQKTPLANGSYEFVSALYVPPSSGSIRVACHNGLTSTQQVIEHPVIPGL